jgi:hypothetical protein
LFLAFAITLAFVFPCPSEFLKVELVRRAHGLAM